MVSLVIVVTDILRQALRQISGACELIAIEEFILECSPEALYEYLSGARPLLSMLMRTLLFNSPANSMPVYWHP